MELTKEQKILQRVLSEAWNNPTYKQELITDPTAAVQKLTGDNFSLPEGKTLEVCDQSNESKVYLNIPVKPNLDNVELNDKQLEQVAGGLYPPEFTGIISDPANPNFNPILTPPINPKMGDNSTI